MFKNKDKIPFEDVIRSQSDYKVLPLTDDIKNDLIPFIEQAIINYNAGPIYNGRVNEFGNHMEEVLRNTNPAKFSKPKKSNGKKQSTGYPDMTHMFSDIVIYDEIKILNESSELSDMRSFYMSTFDKITSDAVHIVIGFEHVDKKLTGKYHIVDMKDKTLAIKIEFACSNKELYK